MQLIYTLILFSIASLTLTACLPEAEPIVPPADIIRPVKIVTVGNQNNHSLRTFPATVEGVKETELAFRVSGQIIKRPIRAGQEIKKGTLIAQLDPKDFKTQVADKEARYNLAKAQYDRAAKVVKKGHVSKAEFDVRKAEMLAAKAALKQAKDNLSYTKIYAPFSGEVAKTYADKHEFVDKKQAIVMMQSADNVYIALQVPEQVIAMVDDPDEAEKVKTKIIFDSHPEQTFLASFHEIDTQADPATRTYKVRLILSKPKKFTVLPGMSAKAIVNLNKISNQTKKTLTIPASCVFKSEADGLQYVWLYDEETQQVQKRAIQLGELTETGIEILDGLKTGEQVVAAGVHQIRDNMQVRPLVNERGL